MFVFLILAVGLVLEKEGVLHLLPLFVGKAFERIEVGFEILHDGLVDDGVLYLGRHLRSLEYLEDETLQEVLLLAKVLVILQLGNLEWVHGDWLFLAVGNIGALEVTAQAFVTISCIYYHDVRVLLVILAHHGVHEEALATSRRT